MTDTILFSPGESTDFPVGQPAYLWLGTEAEFTALSEDQRAAALAPYKVWTNLPSPPCGHFGYEHPSGYCWGGTVDDWLAMEGRDDFFYGADGDIFAFLVVTRELSRDEKEILLDLWAWIDISALCVVDRRLGGSIDLSFLADFYDDLEEERILCFAPPNIGYLPLGAFLSFHPVSNTIIWSNYSGD